MSHSSMSGPCRQVLIVEDESRLREMLAHAITDMGFDVSTARSAEAAVKMLDQQPADIILLDLNLPGINGIELFEIIHKRWPAIQVIVLTGFGDLDVAKRAIRLDVSDFLTKPCPLGDLEIALDRARHRRLVAIDPTYLAPEAPPTPTPEPSKSAAPMTLEEIERAHILAALERNGGNRTATAQELGISLRTLYYRLETYQKQGLNV
ncbi:MAG TPA: response regulator [Tepidisphaeraceae bacterium]|nr:response regulator [Tepidisphaeraceae bacterium]